MSHLGSLKFTKEEYFHNRKSRISSLITQLLVKPYKEEDGPETVLPVNIITAGYSFSDFDFSDIVTEICEDPRYRPSLDDKKFSFYIFDRKDSTEFNQTSTFLLETTANAKSVPVFFSGVLGQTFKALWTNIDKHFRKEISSVSTARITTITSQVVFPRNISRQELTSIVFNRLQPCRYVSAEEIDDAHNSDEDRKRLKVQNDAFKNVQILVSNNITKNQIHFNNLRNAFRT